MACSHPAPLPHTHRGFDGVLFWSCPDCEQAWPHVFRCSEHRKVAAWAAADKWMRAHR